MRYDSCLDVQDAGRRGQCARSRSSRGRGWGCHPPVTMASNPARAHWVCGADHQGYPPSPYLHQGVYAVGYGPSETDLVVATSWHPELRRLALERGNDEPVRLRRVASRQSARRDRSHGSVAVGAWGWLNTGWTYPAGEPGALLCRRRPHRGPLSRRGFADGSPSSKETAGGRRAATVKFHITDNLPVSLATVCIGRRSLILLPIAASLSPAFRVDDEELARCFEEVGRREGTPVCSGQHSGTG